MTTPSKHIHNEQFDYGYGLCGQLMRLNDWQAEESDCFNCVSILAEVYATRGLRAMRHREHCALKNETNLAVKASLDAESYNSLAKRFARRAQELKEGGAR